MSAAPPHAILGSPRRDLVWFLGPGIVTAIVAVLIGTLDPRPDDHEGGPLLWIASVLLVDVAHVWTSLYRTYLDPVARRLHRKRLLWIPLGCAWFGILLHLESPLLFWSVLAYVAIFHFIKQHIGFALIYVRAGGESETDRRMVTAAVWAGTLGPVLWWHANLPTPFAWFVAGDLISGAPAWLGSLALWGQLPIWLAFAIRRITLRRQRQGHPLVPWLVLVPALNWHLGIVVFADDRIFTITNVFLHGVPYMALVWAAGGRDRVRQALGPRGRSTIAVAAAFYGVVAVLAVTEEALWDRLVWHDHTQLFGSSGVELGPSSLAMAVVVAVLTIPQATHYLLDRYIWRVGPQNPALAEQLGLGRR